MSPDLAYPHHVVTAVLVAHDGARWLPDTLRASFGQTRPPQRFVAVDNGSRDRSGALLTESLGSANVLGLPRGTGYGAAIAEALKHPAANSPHTGPLHLSRSQTVEWVWLLHDDCEPAPDALEQLLKAVDENRFATVVGPKLRDWLDRRRLVEVGVTIDGGGRRETGLEAREFDQGQHDGDREALGVSSAGMLVRRDVWEALGGFDSELPLFRDDVDFGWRVNAAGHKVLVATSAVAYHAEASARRRRRISVGVDHPHRIDRRNAMFVLLANLPPGALAWAMVRNAFGSLLRTLVFLLAKQPAHAWDEVVALASVLRSPGRLRKARRARARGRKRAFHMVRKLMPPPGQQFRRLGDMLTNFFTGSGPIDSAGQHHQATTSGSLQESEEEDPLAFEGTFLHRVFTQPGVLLTLVLLVVALVAERALLGGGRFGGGALVPLWSGAGELWNQYASAWHDVGLGSELPAAPYVAVVALLSTLLLGKTWLAVTVLLLGCVPLAAGAAYLAVRRATSNVWVQMWAAAAYALLPVATGAVAAGRLGTAVVTALLPLIGLQLGQMLTKPRRSARRAAWAAGLLVAVATAFVPLVWVLTLILAGLAYLRWRRYRRGLGSALLIVTITPVVLLLPWFWRFVTTPSLLLLEAGMHRPSLVEESLGPLAVLLLHPGGPGMYSLWITLGVVVAGLTALAVPRGNTLVSAGWAVALVGTAAAVIVSAIPVEPLGGGVAAPAWPGVPLALAGAGLILAAAGAVSRAGGQLVAGGWRRWVGLGLAAVACSMPVLAAATWMIGGVSGPLDRNNPQALPAFIAADTSNPTQARTLVLRRDDSGRISYALLRGEEPVLGESELPSAQTARKHLARVTAGLTSGSGSTDAKALTKFGVRYILLPAPIDHSLVKVLDSVPGLSRVSITRDAGLWEVTRPTGRMLLLGKNGSVTPLHSDSLPTEVTIPPGPSGRTLLLAEQSDEGWQAAIDGEKLTPKVMNGWAQGFEVPASGGRVTIDHSSWGRTLWLWLQGIAIFVVLVLALPGARGQEQDQPDDEPERRERKRDRRAPRRARGHRARKGETPAEPVPTSTGSMTNVGNSHQ